MVTDPDLFDENVLRACSKAAARVQRVTRSYCEHADVLSEIYEWVISNPTWVGQYKQQGSHGMHKLSTALYRAGSRYVSAERCRRTGAKQGDFMYYTPAIVEEMLPDVWYYSSWNQYGQRDPDVPRGRSKPSEMGNRQAMMIDIAYAVSTLTPEARELLKLRFADGGLTHAEIARHLDVDVSTVRRRLDRALERVCERLGGEPPFWKPGRKARSNAAAQSDLRRQDEG